MQMNLLYLISIIPDPDSKDINKQLDTNKPFIEAN